MFKKFGVFVMAMLISGIVCGINYPVTSVRDTDGDQLLINSDGSINATVNPTIKSSVTIQGDLGVTGNFTLPATFSSSVTVKGNGGLNVVDQIYTRTLAVSGTSYTGGIATHASADVFNGGLIVAADYAANFINTACSISRPTIPANTLNIKSYSGLRIIGGNSDSNLEEVYTSTWTANKLDLYNNLNVSKTLSAATVNATSATFSGGTVNLNGSRLTGDGTNLITYSTLETNCAYPLLWITNTAAGEDDYLWSTNHPLYGDTLYLSQKVADTTYVDRLTFDGGSKRIFIQPNTTANISTWTASGLSLAGTLSATNVDFSSGAASVSFSVGATPFNFKGISCTAVLRVTSPSPYDVYINSDTNKLYYATGTAQCAFTTVAITGATD